MLSDTSIDFFLSHIRSTNMKWITPMQIQARNSIYWPGMDQTWYQRFIYPKWTKLLFWSVVWNILFFDMLGIIIPSDELILRGGEKPPTTREDGLIPIRPTAIPHIHPMMIPFWRDIYAIKISFYKSLLIYIYIYIHTYIYIPFFFFSDRKILIHWDYTNYGYI